jgi:hypothetical protein
MVAYKKKKKIERRQNPHDRFIAQGRSPEHYYAENPAWAFAGTDLLMWTFSEEHIGNDFWRDILPKLKSFESHSWKEILVKDKKQNHSLKAESLSKAARDRLAAQYIEADSIISLRLTGTHRLYGYITGRVFNIVWYDDNHGDNETCVCRSRLKHT